MHDCESLLSPYYAVQRDLIDLQAWLYKQSWCQTTARIIVVGGTNGKGSTIALLESIWMQAGYRVGVLSSPHLFHFEERIRINQQPVGSETLYCLLERMISETQPLSFHAFDYVFLAALQLFFSESCHVLLIEVGLGGRLDPAKLLSYDCFVMMPVSLDHQHLLGNTRERIAEEKLALLKAHRPCVYADPDPLSCVTEQTYAVSAPLYQLGRDFGYHVTSQSQWLFWHTNKRMSYAYPALLGMHQLLNASAALMVASIMRETLPYTEGDVRLALLTVRCPGRFQLYAYDRHIQMILDVSHNVQSVAVLSDNLARLPFVSRQVAILSIMKDKDASGMIMQIARHFDAFIVLDVPSVRALPAASLVSLLEQQGITQQNIQIADSPQRLCQDILVSQEKRDIRYVIFGSFFVVKIIAEQLPDFPASYGDGYHG